MSTSTYCFLLLVMTDTEFRKRKKIKYKYARDENGGIISVKKLENTPEVRRNIFTCISCGNPLIPKLGKIKQKHFAHKFVCDCSPETYLHLLAKEVFFAEYRNCLRNGIPFYVEIPIDTFCEAYKNDFGIVCNLDKESRKFDITRKYKEISIESEIDGFIPDIALLTPDGSSKLFIEIFVTHKSTEKKISSGFNIIEINIESEEDILIFRDRLISEREGVIFYGFDVKAIKTKCPGEKACPNSMKIFRVFKNGKSICTDLSLPKAAQFLKTASNTTEYYEVIDSDSYWTGEDYVHKVIEVYSKDVPIKNCYLCRYQGDNNRWDDIGKPIFCRFLKIRCGSNQAAECKYFRV